MIFKSRRRNPLFVQISGGGKEEKRGKVERTECGKAQKYDWR